MERRIYLDNSATTRICDEALEKYIEVSRECYGNPSSLHALGFLAERELSATRDEVRLSLGARDAEVVFTASGSEADNLAVFGTAYAKERRRGGKIVTTDSEHPGVERAMQALEKDGFEVIRICTKGGELDWEEYGRALEKKPFLISIMAVNNETGAMYDIKRAFSLAKAKSPDRQSSSPLSHDRGDNLLYRKDISVYNEKKVGERRITIHAA